ncbi:acetoacetate decarboxylase family protein [Streptomyces sp. NPDC003077]|uniref:acetoacetate decarboxylase family protein n=1 Tax=Streptomyces sp. NPDC003077 TaxID=3154443 RepID=UPI0033A8B9FF
MTDTRYPPPPWELVGDLRASVWVVPRGALPAWRLPERARAAGFGGRCVVCTLWVDYQEGGVLRYREFLVGLLVWWRGRPTWTIVVARVDDPAALAGGRQLWSIPKELAEITITPIRPPSAGSSSRTSRAGLRAQLRTVPDATDRAHDARDAPRPRPADRVDAQVAHGATAHDAPLADPAHDTPLATPAPDASRTGPAYDVPLAIAARYGRGLPPLPGRWPLRLRVTQPGHGGPLRVPATLRGRVRLCRGRVRAAGNGPLGFLHGRRPLVSVAVDDFRFVVRAAEPGRR